MPDHAEPNQTAHDRERDAGRVQNAEPRAFSDSAPDQGADPLDNVGRDRDVKLEGAMGGGGDGSDPAGASDDQPTLFGSDFPDRLPRDAVGTDENEIAADDAGASAMAERAGKAIPEQPQ